MWSNSSLICLYFSSVRGVRMRADSSSGLSPPLFSFLLNACQVPQPEGWMEEDTDEGTKGGERQTTMKGQGDRKQEKETKRERKERKVRGRFRVHWEVLTHSLCLLIIRSMSSFIFLYLSSDSGLWPTESSASGSGLSQPFRPFFLNVCKQSSCTTELKGFWGGSSNPGSQFGRETWRWQWRVKRNLSVLIRQTSPIVQPNFLSVQYISFYLKKTKKHFQYIFFFPCDKFGLFLRDCLSKLWTNLFGRFHSNHHQCGVDPEEKTCSETLKMAQWIWLRPITTHDKWLNFWPKWKNHGTFKTS